MKRQALRSPTLKIKRCLPIFTSGISSPFSELFQASRQITHVLRTLAPLRLQNIATLKPAFDLHVLSTPPAFVLSQNQTLRIKTLVDSRLIVKSDGFVILVKLFKTGQLTTSLEGALN